MRAFALQLNKESATNRKGQKRGPEHSSQVKKTPRETEANSKIDLNATILKGITQALQEQQRILNAFSNQVSERSYCCHSCTLVGISGK